uniref:Putative transcription factor TGA3-like n=1 Tax=Davidia involucrata TaxID=16924 RepID=A0A5B7BUJ9_DAVIN
MASDNRGRQHCCFQEWMKLQERDLSELHQALTLTLNTNNQNNEGVLSQLAEKNIQHFQEYIEQRRCLARDDVSAFFAPTWCTALENSLLWIAGCRPSSFIRLVFVLSGLKIESQLTEFLQGIRTGDLGELSGQQLCMVNGLQGKTIREEDKLSSRLASSQEDIADEPFAVIAKELSRIGELSVDTDMALDEHARAMQSILEAADQLRLSTLKELLSILTPVQGVDFLAASKKLQLCIHEWGRKRDLKHGRN